MGWEKHYKDEEIVRDLTKPLSKIWDNILPETFPHLIKFKTNKAVEVFKKKRMGPYTMTERFIDYDCNVKLDNKPLIDVGWNGQRITKEMHENAYGENYFYELRSELVKLALYAGVNFSQFDFGGDIHASVDNI